jgi:hypothetical protein
VTNGVHDFFSLREATSHAALFQLMTQFYLSHQLHPAEVIAHVAVHCPPIREKAADQPRGDPRGCRESASRESRKPTVPTDGFGIQCQAVTKSVRETLAKSASAGNTSGVREAGKALAATVSAEEVSGGTGSARKRRGAGDCDSESRRCAGEKANARKRLARVHGLWKRSGRVGSDSELGNALDATKSAGGASAARASTGEALVVRGSAGDVPGATPISGREPVVTGTC